MATLESIQARIARLQAQAEAIVVNKSTVVLDKIRELMTKHGITVADVEAHAGKRRGRKPQSGAAAKKGASAAKYADPKTGATWTGRGRAPAWIANAKDRSRFLVGDAVAATSINVKAEAKKGNYARGPQPAMYRDPKSGATWSGRGRAPAWIASAKDRTRFLVADAQGAADQPEPAKKASVARTAKPSRKTVSVKPSGAPAKKVAASKETALSTKLPARKATQKKATTAVKKGAAKRPVASDAVKSDMEAFVAVDAPTAPTGV